MGGCPSRQLEGVDMLSLLGLLILVWIPGGRSCNKAVCASDVSRCLIQELCHCKPSSGNCTCCKQCMLCLADLWIKCCDCVGMCNPKNYTDSHPTAKSSVEDLTDPIPSLFRALTDGNTVLNWNIVTISLKEQWDHPAHLLHNYTGFMSKPDDYLPSCRVVYFNDCMSINNCRMSCESMGASKYRWFHNACCECIGPDCLNYGSRKPHCLNCLL
uniref:twisted gastrulation protein homolog 1 isoform X1 n=2 Tax=Myxine glutinosa TaxID=7769 RepID=UPI00358ED410